ncbi:sulfonate ABC transporter substrate-binding protein [Nodosilinea sp. PGN35]|uniref:sulfonate ABC transporter substrate-binding protein n=1 Tax=Nodosilinea sp. PGN35 TaxID=3020489 RepID=UPI0023B307E0|nr:sulfonate ABC transporter substrate-binding protein [Nodosilinea sp. TSF1-S3]MDF0366297.1 sulfonate ABC transporter substrate-binding protein [Nodosilinea sp. TSF1-S3]
MSPIPPTPSRRRFLCQSSLFLGGIALAGTVNACSTESTPQATAPVTTAAAPAAASAGGSKAIRVGYQKSSTILNLLKNQKRLEDRFKGESVNISFNEFAAGPQMLEALNVGSIDLAYTGETPPVFAQAAGAPLLYIAWEDVGPLAEALLVQQDSPIQSVAELKGKKVALNKGSNVHYLLVKALEEAGLQYSDVETAYLPPGDARSAFEQKSVDAWVIWDPFQAAAEKQLGARILRDGKGIVQNRGFYLATKSFVEGNPDLVAGLLEELEAVSAFAKDNPPEVSKFLSNELGIPTDVLDLVETRRGYGIQPITPEVVAYQQDVADVFYNLQLIPKQIDVSTVIWTR